VLRTLQWRRLQIAIRHAYAHTPLYRERLRAVGATPDDIASPEDLRLLPPTTREDLRDPDAILANSLERADLRVSMTSGSTGRRTTCYFDERAWVLARHLLKLRARIACGVGPFDRIALLQEDAPDPPRFGRAARVASFTIHRPVAELLPALRTFAPTVLYGFPGHLALLAEAAPPGALPVRLVFTSGELLDVATRRKIESGLAPVLDVYGCTEAKEIAWQCPERGAYHVNADWIYIEVDPPGGVGRLLVTPLYNRAMPLLRYDVGDTGVALDEVCPCGRGLPLIRPTLGRSVDYLRLPSGARVTPYSLTCAVEAIEGMRQYQFVQIERDLLELRLVPDGAFGPLSEAALRAALAPVVPGVTVQIRLVPAIPPEPSGKYRIVQSR
jgi:phenylacetate-CoA ligase